MSRILLRRNGIRELQEKKPKKQRLGWAIPGLWRKASVVRLLDVDEFPRCPRWGGGFSSAGPGSSCRVCRWTSHLVLSLLERVLVMQGDRGNAPTSPASALHT